MVEFRDLKLEELPLAFGIFQEPLDLLSIFGFDCMTSLPSKKLGRKISSRTQLKNANINIMLSFAYL